MAKIEKAEAKSFYDDFIDDETDDTYDVNAPDPLAGNAFYEVRASLPFSNTALVTITDLEEDEEEVEDEEDEEEVDYEEDEEDEKLSSKDSDLEKKNILEKGKKRKQDDV